ncbi:MAG: hypothetical protein HFJ09_01800 [Lachnospiraceae bacterium]|nr:hypothetical protein [Lachnospiraceae bacterium]
MIYLQIVISLLVQIFALLFLFFSRERESSGKKWKKWFVIVLSFVLTIVVVVIARICSKNLLDFTKVIMLYQIIYCSAVIDYRKKIIPNVLIAFGTGFQIICFFFQIGWYQDDWKIILIQEFVGFLMGAGVLFLVYLFSKKAIGIGDIKLFGVIGITCGFQHTYTILFLSVLLAACYGIYLVLFKKQKKDCEIAFAPFILMGYITSIIISIL